MKKNKEQKNEFQARPPVVVILGHVDHGKTSILDYIRKSKVAEKESGGITQHTGAYQVEHHNKLITFIDTPGHEAFSAMRSRGAKVADIAILVIAAEESIKPQTKEAIQHIKKTGIPVIVAINKIDKQAAQPEKVKSELTKYDIVVESLNGSVPSVNVSAKTGQGLEDLLEMILLVAEMEELKSDSKQPTFGVIVESSLNSKRGNTATIIIKEGTLIVDSLTDIWKWVQEWGKARLAKIGKVNRETMAIKNQFDWGIMNGKNARLMTLFKHVTKNGLNFVGTARETNIPDYVATKQTQLPTEKIRCQKDVPFDFGSLLNLRVQRMKTPTGFTVKYLADVIRLDTLEYNKAPIENINYNKIKELMTKLEEEMKTKGGEKK